MSELTLTDAEADRLVRLKKQFSPRVDRIPLGPGIHDTLKAVSLDVREDFLLDLDRPQIKPGKATFQCRCRDVVILLRLDLNGPPHRNPDGNRVPCPHLHIYREGYDVRWAYSLEPTQFSDPSRVVDTLADFLRYCNFVQNPVIDEGLPGLFS
jgi:hypothetical protein